MMMVQHLDLPSRAQVVRRVAHRLKTSEKTNEAAVIELDFERLGLTSLPRVNV
jgi:hypothetical protein